MSHLLTHYLLEKENIAAAKKAVDDRATDAMNEATEEIVEQILLDTTGDLTEEELGKLHNEVTDRTFKSLKRDNYFEGYANDYDVERAKAGLYNYLDDMLLSIKGDGLEESKVNELLAIFIDMKRDFLLKR